MYEFIDLKKAISIYREDNDPAVRWEYVNFL